MARASPIQTAFNAGEWHATLDGRVDVDRYPSACRILRNFTPLVEGPAQKRSGTRHVALTKYPNDADRPVRLLRFEFSTEDAYILEFGDFYLRVYRDSGQVQLAGIPYEITTPYTSTMAERLKFQVAQSADVVYIAHPDVPTQKLSRTGHTAWTLASVAWDWQPFRAENITEANTVIASAITGAITLTASSALFTANDVGRYFKLREVVGVKHRPWIPLTDYDDSTAKYGGGISVNDEVRNEGRVYRLTDKNGNLITGSNPPQHEVGTEYDGRFDFLYLHSGEGYARIDSFTSTTVVGATVIKELPASVVAAATFRWSFGAWSATSGYPRSISFFEDRLWLAGTYDDPDRIWGSYSGQYENHRPTLDALGAQEYRLSSNQVNMIEGLVAPKVLMMLTSGGEWPARGSEDVNSVISIENPMHADQHTSYGSRFGVQPLAVDNVALFVQRSGRKLREVVFDQGEDSYHAGDISVYSKHLVQGKVLQMAYAQEPNRTIYCVLEDGTLACATYDRPQEVLAWYSIDLGGDAFVESVAVIPHPDGDTDQAWIAVRRTFGGIVTRTIEFFERADEEGVAIEDGFFVDSGLSYDGAPTTTISGADHLEGQEVLVLADGASVGLKTVSGGAVTLSVAASKVTLGLPYEGVLQTMRLEAGSVTGTSQGKLKRIDGISIRTHRTGEGLYLGATEAGATEEVVFRTATDAMGDPVPLHEGDTEMQPWPGESGVDEALTIRHTGPTPCTIVAIMPRVTTEEQA